MVYLASGDVMRAALVGAGTAVMDSGVYWRAVSSAAEARYLVAVLNAPALGEAFRVSRTSGRHFHKGPWRAVPVPAWDAENEAHAGLAALALRAERTVARMELPDGQVAASRRIRDLLAARGVLAAIDGIVREIGPDHAA